MNQTPLTIKQLSISIPTTDGTADGFFFHPQNSTALPGVIFFMDALGLHPGLISMAERLAAQGYGVLLPNLYYRSGPYPPFNTATAFGDEAERARLMGMIRSIDNTMIGRDTEYFLKYLGARSEIKAGGIGCVGYCMGGRYALVAAGKYPEVAAAVCLHGSSLATDKPDSPHLAAGNIRGKVYVGVAGLDANFTPEEKSKLETALAAAGVAYTLETYPDVRHGFAVTGSPAYDHNASERHWEKLLGFFQGTLTSSVR